MNQIFRNIFSVIIGWIAGSAVNMGLITLGHSLYPIEGLDVNDFKAYSEIMQTLELKYFLFPFLAHALGTLLGAFIAALIAASHKMKFAIGVGVLFLIGGIAINIMLSSPTWFAALDIVVAYIPMAFIGGKFAIQISKKDELEFS